MSGLMKAVAFSLMVVLAGCASTPQTGSNEQDEEDPRVKTLVELGTGYLRQGDYIRAKDSLSRALAFDSRSALAHNGMALVFQLQKEYEVAEDHFKAALRSNPDSTQVRNNYGAFLFELERFEDAIEQLAIASEDRFYLSRSTVFENLGLSYQRVGDMPAAEEAFDRAVALNPDQPRALLELASLFYSRQDYVQSRQMYLRFERVSQQSPRSLLLCIRLARVFEQKDEEASCALVLRNIYPASREYAEYQETIGQ